jgi:hypothetical protein
MYIAVVLLACSTTALAIFSAAAVVAYSRLLEEADELRLGYLKQCVDELRAECYQDALESTSNERVN